MFVLNFLLAVPLFIKNNDLPCCVNCIHFIENKNNYDPVSDYKFGKCKLFGVKNIVTCEIDNEYASFCRENSNKCGHRGKYFQEKDGFELTPSFPPILPLRNSLLENQLLEKVEQN
jgi:hypothetical protein